MKKCEICNSTDDVQEAMFLNLCWSCRKEAAKYYFEEDLKRENYFNYFRNEGYKE